MASKVVSTKLSIEEHGKFLQICKQNDSTPSALIKKLILDRISSLDEFAASNDPPKQINDSKTTESVQVKTELPLQKPELQLIEKPEIELEKPKTETVNELAKTVEDKIELTDRVES